MVRIDFYESGIGETIILNFPGGGIGIIDAHPSPSGSRPIIEKLIEGRKIHFVCLAHPHEDHGLDLVKILKSESEIGQFWHTVPGIGAFVYGNSQHLSFPSRYQELIEDLRIGWAEFLMDLYSEALKRNERDSSFLMPLRDDLEPFEIDGVEMFCLSPTVEVKNQFMNAFQRRLEGKPQKKPDENRLSAVLAMRIGESVLLFGADALRTNWGGMLKIFHKRGLKKAKLLKVPHHGAKNALGDKRGYSYLDLCGRDPQSKAVLFAGQKKHPDELVFDQLKEKTELFCISNGRKDPMPSNPLDIAMDGAFAVSAVSPTAICNPVLSFQVSERSDVDLIAGSCCGFCR